MANHMEFGIARGGVIGRDHRQTPKNYQDSSFVVRTPQATIGIVTDGCGSGEHNEVGATLGARLMGNYLATELSDCGGDVNNVRWHRVHQNLLTTLHNLGREMGESLSSVVREFLLFSIVGVILSNDEAMFFSFGDGVVIVNDEVIILEPMEGNQPIYPAYALVDTGLSNEQLQFTVVRQCPLDQLDHFLIGCDGVGDLIQVASLPLPGLEKPVGPISQFWEQDRFFANPDLVSRQLRLTARDWPKRDPVPGLLPDDTTLIVGRRMNPEGASDGTRVH